MPTIPQRCTTTAPRGNVNIWSRSHKGSKHAMKIKKASHKPLRRWLPSSKLLYICCFVEGWRSTSLTYQYSKKTLKRCNMMPRGLQRLHHQGVFPRPLVNVAPCVNGMCHIVAQCLHCQAASKFHHADVSGSTTSIPAAVGDVPKD